MDNLERLRNSLVRKNGDADRQVMALVDRLTKPMYVWRMARGMVGHSDTRQHNAAVKRMWAAEDDIKRIMQEVKAGDHEWLT